MYADENNVSTIIESEQQTLTLNDICLDFQFKADSVMPEFTRFLEKNRTELGLEEAENIADAYIERVWPDNLPGSFIATYASFDEFDRLIIRPPAQGPNAASFAVNGLVPAFGIYRRQAVFVVDSFMLVHHIPPRAFERYVSGQMHTVPNGTYISQEDLTALTNLPRQRKQTSDELNNWLQCLDWQQKLVFIGQDTFRYEGYQTGDDGLMHFLVRTEGNLGKLVRKGGAIMLAAALTESLSPQNWEPDPANRPNFTRLGQVVKAQRLGKNNKFFKNLNTSDKTDEKTSMAIITIKPNPNSYDPLDLQANVIPQEGFLLSSVGGDIKPIGSTRRAINRLCKGFGNNWYLPDYMFNIANAAVPENIADVFTADQPLVNLNAEQRGAVNKVLAAHDITLIQGPPGTGKTTVIVAICYREIQSGKRVLVVSQANTAVDNVLIRLSSDPAIRPLRIGNSNRIEPESQVFLADNAILPWFNAVRHYCIQKLNSNAQIDRKVKDANQAFSNLNSVLGNFENTIGQINEQTNHKNELGSQRQELLAKQKESVKTVERLKQAQVTFNDLIAWTSNPQSSLPSLELLADTTLMKLAKKVVEDISEILSVVLAKINQPESSDPEQTKANDNSTWNRLLSRIKTTVKNFSGSGDDYWQLSWLNVDISQNNSNYWPILESAQKAIAAANDLEKLLSQALVLCSDTNLQAYSPQAVQLKKLLANKAELVNSDNDDDLLKVAQINRQIRQLQSDHWGKICRSIHNLLLVLFPNNLPNDLDSLTSSLQPDSKWTDTLENLKVFCQTITGPCRDILTDSFIEISKQTKNLVGNNKAKIEQTKSQAGDIKANLDELNYQIGEVEYNLENLQAQMDEYQHRWNQLWFDACPDLDEPPPPSQIDRRILDERQHDFQEWLSASTAKKTRQDKWDSIRRDWTVRLDDPKTAEDNDLKRTYVTHANVVGLTCLETGQKSFYGSGDFEPFDTVIIDEVSKATPAELLMPMMCGRKVVLVGDHRQLPPMVKEKEGSFTEAVEEGQINREDFERFEKLVTSSFFENLFDAAPDSIRQSLFAQYRMHPQIMTIINQFYSGKLIAAGGADALGKLRQHHLAIRDRLGGWLLEPHQHVLWIDSSRDPSGKIVTEKQVGSSKVNYLEIELVIASLIRLNRALKNKGYCPCKKAKATSAENGITLQTWVRQLMPQASDEIIVDLFSRSQVRIDGHTVDIDHIVKTDNILQLDGRLPVGVITFYGAQLGQLRRKIAQTIAQKPGLLDVVNIKTNTVDKFQGMEMPIVIVSLVRASYHCHVGKFVKEYRRLNVAFSRAQNLLVIVGSERTFRNATIELPDMSDGTIKKIPAYKNIYDIVTQFGGRRYARQILKR